MTENLRLDCHARQAEHFTKTACKVCVYDFADHFFETGKMVEFPFSPEYIKGFSSESVMVETKTSEKMSEKTSEKIISEIRKNSLVTIAELSVLTGVTTRSVERNLKKLQDAGLLRRVGPDKGGYWELLP